MSYNFNYGSPSAQMPTMFSQGQIGMDQAGGGDLFTRPVAGATGNWMDGFKNMGTPSFMQDGFVPGNPSAPAGNWWDGAIGTTDAPGWGGMALGAAGSLAKTFLGMKQYGLAKDTLNENKRQFGLNYDAQKSQTNGMMEDRQRARVASNAGAYQSVGDYMNKNGIA